jgi:thiol-disulfide isomerase/thioredoxin
MSYEVQAAALGLTGAAVGLTAMAARLTAWHARRRAVGEVGTSKAGEHPSSSEPYILYFTTDHCSTCRLMQEPALEKVGAVVQRIDAIAERELAERYAIFTVPSTVIIGSDGAPTHVNYGYARADKLRQQLAGAAVPA